MTANIRVPDIAIFGAGPAGLFAAEILAANGRHVTLFDRMPSPARKFLMAGRGGLNLTHSEDMSAFLARYDAGAGARRLCAAIEAFPPDALVRWANDLGCETFAGTSGRVFPTAMKASPLLRAWLRRLSALGVVIETRSEWMDFSEDGASLVRRSDGGMARIAASATLLALGGASWPKLGSDGRWQEPLGAAGVIVTPLTPSNCGISIVWSAILRESFAGAPLKRIALTCGATHVRGECVITAKGLEGGAVYQLVPAVREALTREGTARIELDLKPDHSHSEIAKRLSRPRAGATLGNFLRKALHLDRPAIALLRESPLPDGADALAARIKGVALHVTGLAAMERAISSAGGVAWPAFDDAGMLQVRPGVFVAGEMLDWDAPTGGYLLQATFATSHKAAHGMLRWLANAQTDGVERDSVPRLREKME